MVGQTSRQMDRQIEVEAEKNIYKYGCFCLVTKILFVEVHIDLLVFKFCFPEDV